MNSRTMCCLLSFCPSPKMGKLASTVISTITQLAFVFQNARPRLEEQPSNTSEPLQKSDRRMQIFVCGAKAALLG